MNADKNVVSDNFIFVCGEQLLSAIAEKAKLVDASLPQDSFEGVDNDEWVIVFTTISLIMLHLLCLVLVFHSLYCTVV